MWGLPQIGQNGMVYIDGNLPEMDDLGPLFQETLIYARTKPGVWNFSIFYTTLQISAETGSAYFRISSNLIGKFYPYFAQQKFSIFCIPPQGTGKYVDWISQCVETTVRFAKRNCIYICIYIYIHIYIHISIIGYRYLYTRVSCYTLYNSNIERFEPSYCFFCSCSHCLR